MRLFKRSGSAERAVDDETHDETRDQTRDEAQGDAQGEAPEAAAAQPSTGPWDASAVERGSRVDLGSLWLPPRQGMELRLEVEEKTRRVTAANVLLAGSAVQLQAFAAPRTEGVWDDIRADIRTAVQQQGGSVDEVPGEFGTELLARVPVRTADGRTGHQVRRFCGVDGPRWFLRAVFTGPAAFQPDAAVALEEVVRDVVVVRGVEAMAPRELLPLSLPAGASPGQAAPAQQQGQAEQSPQAGRADQPGSRPDAPSST